jgi:hypothetical protein
VPAHADELPTSAVKIMQDLENIQKLQTKRTVSIILAQAAQASTNLGDFVAGLNPFLGTYGI